MIAAVEGWYWFHILGVAMSIAQALHSDVGDSWLASRSP